MEKLLNFYNDIVDQLLPNCLVDFDKDKFECDMETVSNFGTIYNITVGIIDEYVAKDLSTRQKNKNIQPEIFAILHEIGHCKTYSKKRNKHYEKWASIYNNCKNIEKAIKIHNNLSWEKMADGYANNFIDKNWELVNKWNSQIIKIKEELE